MTRARTALLQEGRAYVAEYGDTVASDLVGRLCREIERLRSKSRLSPLDTLRDVTVDETLAAYKKRLDAERIAKNYEPKVSSIDYAESSRARIAQAIEPLTLERRKVEALEKIAEQLAILSKKSFA